MKKKEIIDLQGDNVLSNSPNIYEILTNKNTEKKWEDLDKEEKNILGAILVQSKAIYSNYNTNRRENTQLKGKREQWRNLYSHVWFNRFAFMKDGNGMFKKEEEQAKKYLKSKNERITEFTKNIIRKKLNKQTGSGLKKNYVTLPSDPCELVDRLTLLAGSKDAGNTGVYNEMVSICDELLKKKIIGKGQYKEFLSNI